MAEFEGGYCTGCGIKARRWGHRPYCWRRTTMMLGVYATKEQKERCLREMYKHWRIRSLFLVRAKHMYHLLQPRYRCLDRLGWPVERVYGRPVLNFFRLLIHTRRIARWSPPPITSASGAWVKGDAT